MSDYFDLSKRENAAVIINKFYDNVDIHITVRGSDWYWSAFCIFVAFAMVIIGFMFRKPANERLFYYTAIAPVTFMAVHYFTLASNLGWIPIKVKYNHARTKSEHGHHGTRQVFYTRYIAWFVSFPWPIIQASLLGNTPLWQIAFNVGLTDVYVVVMLVAAVVHTTYKWGYYVIAIAAGIVTCISVMTTTRNLVKKISSNVLIVFYGYMTVVMIIWFCYPLCFGLAEGGNVLQPDSEGVFYGVLDVIFLGILPMLFVPVASYIGFEKLGLDKTVNQYGHNSSALEEGTARPPPAAPSAPAAPSNGSPASNSHPGKKTKKVKKVKKVKKSNIKRNQPTSEKAHQPSEEGSQESRGY